jgi:hypothetical protein
MPTPNEEPESPMKLHKLAPWAFSAMMIPWLAPATAEAQAIKSPPPAGTFQLRPDLQGVHPRLHFTAADIPSIRERGKGPSAFFVERMKSSFGSYKGKSVSVGGLEDWKNYLFGLWASLSMNLLFIVEEDGSYADTAKSWALHFARSTSWPASADDTDHLISQEIVTGMAMTYDILYDQFTPDERKDIRTKLKSILDVQYDRFFVGSYWTNDFQNNHMHNRIGGLGHAAIAILGDDPAIDVQKHADLAYYAQQQVSAWGPTDGSTHEGPGYWSYGYHWVTRINELFIHTTGTTHESEHDRNFPYYRLYLLTPGMLNTFGIADTGGYGPAQNLEAILPTIPRYQDEVLHGFLKDQMQRNADGFYQQVGWGLLWYDPTVGDKDVKTLPLNRTFMDLDMVSVRGGWEEADMGAVFICGPPGGHLMQQMKEKGETSYINVAHDHPDQNHFMIWAHGKMLTDDDGYPKSPDAKLTASHNTILIDGEGGPEEGTGWYQPFPYEQTAFLQDAVTSGATAYAAGNASRLYTHGERFIRHFAFVEGEYVMIIDDLKGKGTDPRTFDWRLHKQGEWSKIGGTEFEVKDGDAALHVRFVGPGESELTSEFFAAAGSAKPGLSVETKATETQFLAVLTPRLGGSPVVQGEQRSAVGGWAIRAEVGGKTDLFAASSGAGAVEVDDVEVKGAAALLRRQGTAMEFALIARATSLDVDGKTILGSDSEANLTWRPNAVGGRLEVEPPYKEAGNNLTLAVGGLDAAGDYCVSVDGVASGKVTADGSGVAELSLDVQTKREVVFEAAGSGEACPVDVVPDGGTGGTGGTGASGGGGAAGDSGAAGSGVAGTNDGDGGGCACTAAATPFQGKSLAALLALALAYRKRRTRNIAAQKQPTPASPAGAQGGP